MKKVKLVFIMLLSGAITYACGNYNSSSSLKLKLWNNSTFRIVLDGQQYSKTSFFNLSQLAPGNHTLMVVKTIQPHHGNGGYKKVLYNGSLHIPYQSKIIATVTPNRSLDIKVLSNNAHNVSCGQVDYNQQVNCTNNYGNTNHYYAMDDYSFGVLLNPLRNNNFDSGKLTIAKQAMLHNRLNTKQVVIVMNEFSL